MIKEGRQQSRKERREEQNKVKINKGEKNLRREAEKQKPRKEHLGSEPTSKDLLSDTCLPPRYGWGKHLREQRKENKQR